MNKKMAIFTAILAFFFIISFCYLEYKISTKKSNSLIHLSKDVCLRFPVNCVHKKNIKGLTLFCKGGESAHIKNHVNLRPSPDHKKIVNHIKHLNIYKNDKLSDNDQSNYLVYGSTSEIFEFTISHKGRKSFLIDQIMECDRPGNDLHPQK